MGVRSFECLVLLPAERFQAASMVSEAMQALRHPLLRVHIAKAIHLASRIDRAFHIISARLIWS